MPGRMPPAYDDPTSRPLVSQSPTAQPKNPAASNCLTPTRGISAVPMPIPAPIVRPNGR